MTVRENAEETVEETQPIETEEVETDDDEKTDDDVSELVEALADRLGPAMESVVDRRITSLMKTLRTEYGIEKNAASAPAAKPQAAASDIGMTRQMLRMAIREEMQFQEFTSKDEAKAARDMALKFADRMHVESVEDVDDIAQEIVQQVTTTMGSMKETYQKQLRSNLKKRGLLRDEEEETTSPSRNSAGDSHSAQKAWDRGAELAKQKFGHATVEET